MTGLSPAQITEGLTALGVLDLLVAVDDAGTPEGKKAKLAALRDAAHRAFRKAAKQLHPDMNGGSAEKTARLHFLREIVTFCDRYRGRRKIDPLVEAVAANAGFSFSGPAAPTHDAVERAMRSLRAAELRRRRRDVEQRLVRAALELLEGFRARGVYEYRTILDVDGRAICIGIGPGTA